MGSCYRKRTLGKQPKKHIPLCSWPEEGTECRGAWWLKGTVEASQGSRATDWPALCLLWPLKTASAFARGRGVCSHLAFLSASLCDSGRAAGWGSVGVVPASEYCGRINILNFKKVCQASLLLTPQAFVLPVTSGGQAQALLGMSI